MFFYSLFLTDNAFFKSSTNKEWKGIIEKATTSIKSDEKVSKNEPDEEKKVIIRILNVFEA